MKTLAEQVRAFMDWKSKTSGVDFTPTLMASLVARFQQELPQEKRCTRQNIEGLLLKDLQTPRYLVALAKAMGTTAEILKEGKFAPALATQPATAPSDLRFSARDTDQAAIESPATLGQTLERLGALLEKADAKTRNDVSALLARYAQDPAEGKRLAQAIEILLKDVGA